jgi:DNA replication and repair protein RecF
VQESVKFLQQAYEYISASSHFLQFAYRSPFDALAGELEAINPQRFMERLGEYRVREKQRGQTLVGPHRDDLELTIDDVDLRRFGSRGEHKSVLMALKMLETEYLKKKLDTAPIILLDDLISELDETRSRQCLEHFTGRGQLFVSAVSLMDQSPSSDSAKFQIQAGNVVMTN